MILLISIAAGWLAGMGYAAVMDKDYQVEELSHSWLVLAAVIPQLLIFQVPVTARLVSAEMAAGLLVISQTILLGFVLMNWRHVGIQILGIGLILNLLVIIANGGLMPISPESLQALYPDFPASAMEFGVRVGSSKNILLPVSETVLAGFSDSILLPEWFPWTRALSLGDLLVAVGAFWLLALGKVEERDPRELIGIQQAGSLMLFQKGRKNGDHSPTYYPPAESDPESDWF